MSSELKRPLSPSGATCKEAIRRFMIAPLFRVLPGLVVEEHQFLFDGLAADPQLIAGEVWVGIADCQAAQDRQFRRNSQLRGRSPDT